MSTTTASVELRDSGGLRNAFGRQLLYRYPVKGMRYFYLGIVVMITIVLYNLYYAGGGRHSVDAVLLRDLSRNVQHRSDAIQESARELRVGQISSKVFLSRVNKGKGHTTTR